jgi:2-oxoglutarate dehydrogenase E2 component (dihydrolipoamide succinyltransferase)
MSIEVKIPAVGESISSGIISVWHKKSGEFVKAGEPLFTLETDKVSTEITAEKDGVLTAHVPEGQEVKIGETVASIDETATSPAAPAVAKTDSDGAKKPKAEKLPEKKSAASDVLSPAVRRIVEEEKIDPQEIKGSGKGGRLTKGDVLTAAQNREAHPPSGSITAPERDASISPQGAAISKSPADGSSAAAAGERFTRRKMSPLRRKIAAQLVMAQHTAAILTTFNECDMSAVQALRARSQEAFTKKNGLKLGFMSFFIKAAVEALKTVPSLNGRIEGDDFIDNHFYDIGVAVGTERGLIVPVVRDADRKSFAELERDIADYANKARDGKIKIEDLQGGSFTVSNGGVYGSLLSTPILNPPQTGILGMHKIMDRAVVVGGKVEPRPMMYLALSYDHRAVDGKEGVTFLIKVKECIEDPTKLPIDF